MASDSGDWHSCGEEEREERNRYNSELLFPFFLQSPSSSLHLTSFSIRLSIFLFRSLSFCRFSLSDRLTTIKHTHTHTYAHTNTYSRDGHIHKRILFSFSFMRTKSLHRFLCIRTEGMKLRYRKYHTAAPQSSPNLRNLCLPSSVPFSSAFVWTRERESQLDSAHTSASDPHESAGHTLRWTSHGIFKFQQSRRVHI